MLRELVGLVLIIMLVALALGGAASWIRRFADLLWIFAIATKTVALASLIVIAISGLLIHILLRLPLVSPLAMTIILIVLPFAAIPLANVIARLATLPKWYQPSTWPKSGWKNCIFNERRIELGRAYEAPRVAQDWMPDVSPESEDGDETQNASSGQPRAG